MITHETRRKSNRMVDRLTRPKLILQTYARYGPMTSRECANILGYHDLNAVKPRITELCKHGMMRAVEEVDDVSTHRKVAKYELVTDRDRTMQVLAEDGLCESDRQLAFDTIMRLRGEKDVK